MSVKQVASVIAASAVFLLGCEQRHETIVQPAPNAPSTSVATTDTAAQPARDPQSSAASSSASSIAKTAPGDPSLPPHDGASSTPKTEKDASGESALTAGERSQAMPMPGQANDYNTPDRAKQQNDANTGKETNR